MDTLEFLHLHYAQQFSVLQDTDSILLNNSFPRSHLHSWSNETVIPLKGITVQREEIYFVSHTEQYSRGGRAHWT